MNAKYTAFKKIFEKHSGLLRVFEAVQLGVPEPIVYEMIQGGDLVKEARGLLVPVSSIKAIPEQRADFPIFDHHLARFFVAFREKTR